MKKRHLIYLCGLLIFLGSCSYTKHVPQNQRLLWDQDIYENGKKGAEPGAENILKQRPNQKVIWTMPKVAIYNWGNGNDSNFFSKIGEAPVIFDSVKTRKGAEQLRYFYFNKGYFGATSSFDIELYEDKRWANVNYYVKTGKRFHINTYEVKVETKELKDLINFFSSESLIKEGDPYDADVLENERARLVDMFRNEGYYNFSKNYIEYKADTTVGGYLVDVWMEVSQKLVKQGDTTVLRDHEKYYMNKIFIQPDYNYQNRTLPADTLLYRGYHITYDTLDYKPRYLTDAIHFEKGDKYKQQNVRETYAHLVGYQAFEITEIKIEEAGRDSLGPLLNTVVHLNPLPKMTLVPQPEVTTSNGYGGINFSLSFIHRNIFKGGESFEFKVSTGFDYQATVGSDIASQAFELGAEAGINFPRFLLPFNTVGLLPKRMRPRSKISLYVNRTSRFEFDRETFGGKISYMWNETRLKSWTVDLLDITFSKLYEINPTFRDNLNDFQFRSFQSEFIEAFRTTFIYNGQLNEKQTNPHYFKGVFETGGNLIRLAKMLGPANSNNDNTLDSVAGVLYYQYIRPEADYRFYWNFAPKFTWANRAYTGVIIPYGNSIDNSEEGAQFALPPFSKFFFMGGSNDLRAWPAYRLGAGTQRNTNYTDGRDTTFALGTVKFLLSSELRFPIYGYFEGAVFLDAGNIWLTGGLEEDFPGSEFEFNNFYNEFALGTGFGLRLNLDFFVLRLDVGVKVRDPGLINSDPWVIRDRALQPQNWTWNFALGYPF